MTQRQATAETLLRSKNANILIKAPDKLINKGFLEAVNSAPETGQEKQTGTSKRNDINQ